jgi:hypothetical protein
MRGSAALVMYSMQSASNNKNEKDDKTRTRTKHTSTSPKSSTSSSPSYEEQNFTAKKPQSLFTFFGTSIKVSLFAIVTQLG